jgi:hypothetical protein
MYSSSIHFGDATPFKVQVDFDIPLFVGQIDTYSLEKWLNLLEDYFSIHNFSDKGKITFVLLKALPHIKHWWGTYWETNSVGVHKYLPYLVKQDGYQRL